MAQANQVLHIDGKNAPGGMNNATPVAFVPNRVAPEAQPANEPVWPTLFLGDGPAILAETLEAVARLIERTPTDTAWTILVSPETAPPAAWEKYRGRYRLVPTSEPLLRVTARLNRACLLVPGSILDRHSAFDVALMEEDLLRNGSALSGLPEAEPSLPGEFCESWFREQIEEFRAARAARGGRPARRPRLALGESGPSGDLPSNACPAAFPERA